MPAAKNDYVLASCDLRHIDLPVLRAIDKQQGAIAAFVLVRHRGSDEQHAFASSRGCSQCLEHGFERSEVQF